MAIILTPETAGMPMAHAQAIAEFCKLHDIFVFIRPSEAETMQLIDAGFATKSMDIHDKSSHWGPMAGAVPLDRGFSKKVSEYTRPLEAEGDGGNAQEDQDRFRLPSVAKHEEMLKKIKMDCGNGCEPHHKCDFSQHGVEQPIQLLISEEVRSVWERQGKIIPAPGFEAVTGGVFSVRRGGSNNVSEPRARYYKGQALDKQGELIHNDITDGTLFILEKVQVPDDVLAAWDKPKLREVDSIYWRVSWRPRTTGDGTQIAHYDEARPLFVWGYPIAPEKIEANDAWREDVIDYKDYRYPWKCFRAVTGDYDLWMVAPHMAWWKLNMHVVKFTDQHGVPSAATFFTNWLNTQLNKACQRESNPVFNHGAEEQNYGFTQALDQRLVMFTSSGNARMVDMDSEMPRIMVELMCSGYLALWNKRYDEPDPVLGHKHAIPEHLELIANVQTRGRELGRLTEDFSNTPIDVLEASVTDMWNYLSLSRYVREARTAFADACTALREADVDLSRITAWSHKMHSELDKAKKKPGEHVGFQKLSKADINDRPEKVKGQSNYWTVPDAIFKGQQSLQNLLMRWTIGGGSSDIDMLERVYNGEFNQLATALLEKLSEDILEAPNSAMYGSSDFIPPGAGSQDTYTISLRK
jgi:hypothetical protein